MKSLLILSACIAITASGTFSWGGCPNVSLQSNFNIDNYLGSWYEMVRNKDMKYEKGDCNKAEYGMNADGTVSVHNIEYVNSEYSDITGYATCSKKNPAQCYVKFFKFAPAGDYKVVATDYDNYTIVFSCTSIGIAHWKWAWILAREPDFDFAQLIPSIEALGINADQLYITQQTNCPN